METTEGKLPPAIQKWIDDQALEAGAARVICNDDDMDMDDAVTLLTEEETFEVPLGIIVWEPFEGESREQIVQRVREEAEAWRLTAMTVARMTLDLCGKEGT